MVSLLVINPDRGKKIATFSPNYHADFGEMSGWVASFIIFEGKCRVI
jgi:hypothetical protein